MKHKLYVHIGLPKTGTTAIQNFLERNAGVLASKGYCYPGAGLHGSDTMFGCQPGNGYFFIHADKYEACGENCRKICREIKEAHSDALITSEDFLGCTIEHVKDCLRLFEDFEIKIILYLRRHDNFFQSLLQTSIRNKQLYDYENTKNNGFSLRFADENKRAKVPYYTDFFSGKWSVKSLLQEYANAFGKENIILRCYEKQQLVDGNIFTDFLSILGLKLTDEFSLPGKQINPRMSRDFIEFRRLLNHPEIARSEVDQIFSDALWRISTALEGTQMFTQFDLISPADCRQLIDTQADHYEYIAREYLGRDDGVLFYDPLPDPDAPWEPIAISNEEVILGFGKILSDLATGSQQTVREIQDRMFRQNEDYRSQIELLSSKLSELETSLQHLHTFPKIFRMLGRKLLKIPGVKSLYARIKKV